MKILQTEFAYKPPYDWERLLNFFAVRTLDGVEHVEGNSYQRLFTCGDGAKGWFKAEPTNHNTLKISFRLNTATKRKAFESRIRHMFDLDADPMAIYKDLRKDKGLRPHLNKYPGIRVPGCWGGFEAAVRAIVGQQISVKGAITMLNRMVERCGEKESSGQHASLHHYFPTPKALVSADLSNMGLPQSKIKSIQSVAHAVLAKDLLLDGTADYQKTCDTLLAIKGIGPWTVEYMAMRSLKNPDAFPKTDLVIKKQIQTFKFDDATWSPWRAYVATLLWAVFSEEQQT